MSTALNASVIKALEILDIFAPDRPDLTAKIVSERLDMTMATAHRFLLTLEHTGYVISTRRGQFEPGQKLEDIGRLAFELNPLPRIARPEVDGLSQALNESVMACRLGRRHPTCVVAANSPRAVHVSAKVGTTLPLLYTAQGKLFMAHMNATERAARFAQEREAEGTDLSGARIDKMEADFATIRTEGYATNLGENEPEIGAIAVPVFGAGSKVVLTISVFGILSQIKSAPHDKVVDMLKSAAGRISQQYTQGDKHSAPSAMPDWSPLVQSRGG